MAGPYLRFWLAFLDPHMAEIERMRGDLTLSRIKEQWTSWRGRAIEPLVRESLARLLPTAPAIGGHWTRSNDVEIDLAGADRQHVAKQSLFCSAGSRYLLLPPGWTRRQEAPRALSSYGVRGSWNCAILDLGAEAASARP